MDKNLKVKCFFVEKPGEMVAKEIGKMFSLSDAVISIDSTDVAEILSNAENVILLHGKASGRNRLSDAIEDAVLHTCSVANGLDLFSANKVLLYIFSPKSNPLLMSEIEAVNVFFEIFHSMTFKKMGI